MGLEQRLSPALPFSRRQSARRIGLLQEAAQEPRAGRGGDLARIIPPVQGVRANAPGEGEDVVFGPHMPSLGHSVSGGPDTNRPPEENTSGRPDTNRWKS